MPSRERYLFVCTNRRDADDPKGSCAAKDSEEIADALKTAIAKLGAKKTIRACRTSCLDLCEIGASIVLEPDHIAYGRVTLGDVDEIARATAEGRVVERLVVHRPKPKPKV